MRFQVRFEYDEATGEVSVFQVDAVPESGRAGDHDRLHDQVSAELAGLLEVNAEVVEQEEPGIPGRRRGWHTDPGETSREQRPEAQEESGG
ncbi:hypothetical protein [Actinoplanes derwentensis]|uniref:FtsH ternary system domain-containing protein n=1 Tax=Actinoplanes derwentensis TaxID=113562 RepID=A0A1H2AIJ7_9ACTN|nr:hypothetical protein [Actinoplanes derwentensis]GID90298.1 hypothetical protein Ade03nite_92220 [Actinoplanes derwentensis]SDT45825.1 hypothetical protein SAMN04489716_3890 [Actinoplanes derwentensis]